ncbi:MAG TPA: ribulose-phosphate 3-epimerase [Candidatus Gallacutalibacter stercoravium]|nr:ribulose-phosphate 3-epimerase [Candidatus Gallacutalibacter stercoravium]
MKPLFAPSLMCADLLSIKEQVEILNDRADLYHIDIMDGHFVRNFSLSPSFVEQIKPVAKLPMDVHLMVEHPEDFLEMLARAGADYISPHAETINRDAFRTYKRIRELGCKTGVVLNPATPLEYVRHYLHLLDKITILTVDAGFVGQTFIPEMLKKIEQAKEWKEKYGYTYLIEVDGSCNEKTYRQLSRAGCEVFIVGASGLFQLDPDLRVAWEKMQNVFHRCTAA